MILTGEAKLAGVMGWPVGHSRSPRLHGWWLAHYGIDGAYLPLAVRPEQFAQALRTLPHLGFRGVNVTVPHKEAALAAVDIVDDHARRIGAVNTVIVHPDGALEGRNTDGVGFLAHLTTSAPAWGPHRGPAAVIGAGGAARAIVVALLDAGVPEVHIVNRTRERAESLALALSDDRIKVMPWLNRAGALRDAALVVNTTTQGMRGQLPLDLDLAAMPSGAAVFDCVYAPLETPLLAAARARGLVAVDGLGMLIHQARPGFAAWFGRDPQITPELHAFLAEGL
ncbi:MAG TPA: shikimate dehydrogenase [Alphaproteobacteria bacterium]|jgi:shikimate dehydrogenase